jgi:hypothetical protein
LAQIGALNRKRRSTAAIKDARVERPFAIAITPWNAATL